MLVDMLSSHLSYGNKQPVFSLCLNVCEVGSIQAVFGSSAIRIISSSVDVSLMLILDFIVDDDIKIGRVDKSLGGPKPSWLSVASITSFETCVYDKGLVEDSNI